MIGYSAPARPGPPDHAQHAGRDQPDAEGETLDAFVTRQVADLQARASGFNLKLRRDARLDGVACIEIVFAWAGGDSGRIQQRQIYALRPGDRVISITHTAPEAEFAGFDGLSATSSFAWRMLSAFLPGRSKKRVMYAPINIRRTGAQSFLVPKKDCYRERPPPPPAMGDSVSHTDAAFGFGLGGEIGLAVGLALLTVATGGAGPGRAGRRWRRGGRHRRRGAAGHEHRQHLRQRRPATSFDRLALTSPPTAAPPPARWPTPPLRRS